MDFLDNLENSLKNLESQEERDPTALQRQQQVREQAIAAAPWAEKLKTSEYTQSLFTKAALAGHKMRAKIYMAWLESTLRLEVRGHWCELKPSSHGVVAYFLGTDGELITRPVDLNEDPETLLNRWLETLRSSA